MKTALTISRIMLLAIFVLPVSAEPGAPGSDVVFNAMQDEMSRSLAELKLPEASQPYFISYRVTDREEVSISGRYGALTQSEQTNSRTLSTDLRVGDAKFDNSGFISNWGNLYQGAVPLTIDDDYSALRRQIWLHTDGVYKRAVEDLSRKSAWLQSHPQTDLPPNLAPMEKSVQIAGPTSAKIDVRGWENSVREASTLLQEYPLLQEWQVDYRATRILRRYLNCEGTRYEKGDVVQFLEISATSQAEDGQRLTSFRRFFTRETDQPPAGEQLAREVRQFGKELTTATQAGKIESYTGPVLFEGYAAAQLLSILLAAQITPAQSPLCSEEWMQQQLKLGKLTGRIGRRVLPDFISISDEPTRRNFEGKFLLGYRLYDEEGVPSQDLTLVRDGRLMTLPTDRQPSTKIPLSNGHSVSLTSQRTAPGVTNLILKSSRAKATAKVVQEMRKLCLDAGNEYGIIITLLESPDIADNYRWGDAEDQSDDILPPVAIAFKVDAKTGETTPVRGLAFEEPSVRSLRDIILTGKDDQAYNLTQSSYVPGIGYPATIITPSLLVEEMDLKATKAREPLPIIPSPLAETNVH